MKEFDYFRPTSVDEACLLKAEWGDEGRVLAGGQSLLNMMKLRFVAPGSLIDARRLEELKIAADSDGGQRIGSMMTYAQVGRVASERYPIIADALDVIADLQVRNLGPLGGSCCQADPFGDMPNVVTALDARFEIRSSRGTRHLAAAEFFRGPLETALDPDELLIAVHFPAQGPRTGSAYEKFSWRRGDYAIVSIAAVVTLDEGGRCVRSSLVAGALGVGPVRLARAERVAIGQLLTGDAIVAVADEAQAECTPQDDPVYGSAQYKRALIKTLTVRALTRACDRARAS